MMVASVRLGARRGNAVPHLCRCPHPQSNARHRSCGPLLEHYAVTRDVVTEAVRIVSLRLEHATAAGHRVDRQIGYRRCAPERRGCCDARRCIVGQDDEQIPVAGIVSVATCTAAEQEDCLWLHLSNDTLYRRPEPRIRSGHDRTDRKDLVEIGASARPGAQVGGRSRNGTDFRCCRRPFGWPGSLPGL